jgi:hypothetical protein
MSKFQRVGKKWWQLPPTGSRSPPAGAARSPLADRPINRLLSASYAADTAAAVDLGQAVAPLCA